MFHKNVSIVFFAGLFLFLAVSLTAQTPQELRLGSSLFGNLRVGEELWYNVRAGEAGFLIVETSGNDVDTYLEAYDASNNLIAIDDDSGEDYNARLEIAVEAGRTYRIKLNSYDGSQRGSFRIWASYEPFPQDEELRFGSSLSRTLSAGGAQWFSVRSSQNGFVAVETSGSVVDTYLRAYDASYKLISFNDDGGEDSNAFLEIYVESGKIYFFKLTGYDNEESGQYRIWASFEPIPADTERNTERSRAVTIRLGEAFPVILRSASESRWYRFDIPSSGTTFVVQTMGSLDTTLFLYDSRGNLIVEDDDSGDYYNAMISERLNSGTVYIEVREYSGQIGRCTLHAEIR